MIADEQTLKAEAGKMLQPYRFDIPSLCVQATTDEENGNTNYMLVIHLVGGSETSMKNAVLGMRRIVSLFTGAIIPGFDPLRFSAIDGFYHGPGATLTISFRTNAKED